MATVYLSSTYEDLREHRQAVYALLRKAGHEVRAMEDYIACDERPLARCLDDVRAADIYVGLFAFRYGYVPPAEHGNPEKLSITELECCCAKDAGKPRLLFFVDEKTPWPRSFDDLHTCDGERGESIARLRRELLAERLATKFDTPDELAGLVVTAVGRQVAAAGPAGAAVPGAAPELTWDIDRDGSPYPGLMRFTEHYRAVYVGRDAEVDEVLARLRDPGMPFVLVHGDSGVGKSSLVEAGVLPRLKAAAPGAAPLMALRMAPSQGSDPFDALGRALQPLAERAGWNAFERGRRWLAEPATLVTDLRTLAARASGGLVLFVDQMEELFTAPAPSASGAPGPSIAPATADALGNAAAPDPRAVAAAFVTALHAGAAAGTMRVVATLRSDFLQHCHHHEPLRALLNGGAHYALGRAAPHQLRDMVALPAQRAGLEIAPRLVDRLVTDAGQEPGHLPLLAFVLQRLFEQRDGRRLTEAAYDACGGVDGAIAAQAATVEQALGDTAATALERLFPLLVQVSAEGQATRLHLLRAALADELLPVADHLLRARLLAAEAEGAGATRLSVAHERLFSAWPRLAGWIESNRDDLRLLRHADNEAGEWQRHGHAPAYLWRVDRLRHLRQVLQRFAGRPVSERLQRFANPQGAMVDVLRGERLTHAERLEIGLMLAEFGDPRRGVGLDADGVPDIDWVPIPGGRVVLEDDADEYQVEPCEIARYPVTCVQFRAFVDADDGWQDSRWWRDLGRPGEPASPEWSEPNVGCTHMSWFEAVAFTRWFSNRLGLRPDARQAVRLPDEFEWQQAATGGHPGRQYPWGSVWDRSRANSGDGGPNRATPVGLYWNGRTEQQVQDMAGNVWEWCRNPLMPNGSETRRNVSVLRVRRGGSWNDHPSDARASNRYGSHPGGRSYYVGFRVCRASPI